MYNQRVSVSWADIWDVDLGKREGSVQSYNRPCIIISNDLNNKYAPTVQVVPLTSKYKKVLPVHVLIKAEVGGLEKDSLALTEQIQTVDKSQLKMKITRCPDYIMQDIWRAIQVQQGWLDTQKIEKLCKNIISLENDMLNNKNNILINTLINIRDGYLNELKDYCKIYNKDYNTYLNRYEHELGVIECAM